MADRFIKTAEKQEDHVRSSEKKEKAAHGEHEIKEASRGFIEGVSEVVEGAEAAEFAEGEISEKTGEGRKKAAATGIKAGGVQAAQKTKAVPPTIEIMRIQISTQVEKEIRLLEKEAARLMRSPGDFNPFKLNGMVAKIRELKDILANLAYATAETIKGLWMKYVKGITV